MCVISSVINMYMNYGPFSTESLTIVKCNLFAGDHPGEVRTDVFLLPLLGWNNSIYYIVCKGDSYLSLLHETQPVRDD